ncbi:UNVERIFIED_ORG: cell division protein FtsB [Sphingomonas sp. R1F5B]
MIWAFVLRAALWLRRVAPALLAAMWRMRVLIIVAVLALLVWHYAGLAARRGIALVEQAENSKQAQANAQQAAQAAIAHQESTWRLKAQIEDTKHATELADARAAADRYIADHRVRPQAVQSGGGAGAAAGTGDRAGLREDLPAAGVVVSDQDVQACTEVTAYALALREWALGLNDPPAE